MPNVRTVLLRPTMLALAAATIVTVGRPAAAAPKLTCTFIHKQCMTECVKQAGRGFCQFHCDGERRSCMTSGRWSSFGRNFESVVRR